MKNRTLLILVYALILPLLIGLSFLPSGLRVYRQILALMIPLIIGVSIFVKRNGTKIQMFEGKGEVGLASLFFAPTLLLIILISLFTSLILSLFGLSNTAVESLPIGEAILRYAIFPAILEEALYRILPLLALKDEDAFSVCIFSSLVFGFSHLSLFSIPYAFFSGFAFFCINRLAKSPFPSLFLHLTNNLLSLWMMFSKQGNLVLLGILVTLFVLSALSVILMAKFYRERVVLLLETFRKKRVPFRFTLDILIYLTFTLTAAIVFF